MTEYRHKERGFAVGKLTELENSLKLKDEKIKELRKELREATDLNDELTEQVQSANELFDQWIDAFEMVIGEDGKWTIPFADLQNERARIMDQYQHLLRDWNRFVGKYNDVVAEQPAKSVGRPLAASEGQVKEVMRCH